MNEIIRLIEVRPSAPFHETVDAVRIFINDHSQTKAGRTFHAMNRDNVAFAEGIIAHAHDASVERVHMECSTRAYLMTRVLRSMGVETRGRNFRYHGDYSSHSFLEGLNAESKTWEAVDPDYDLSKSQSAVANAYLWPKPAQIDDSVCVPRAALKRKLSFQGETGTFCELFPRRCRDGFNRRAGTETRAVR